MFSENSQLLKAVNYYHKTLHLRCLTGIWIHFCISCPLDCFPKYLRDIHKETHDEMEPFIILKLQDLTVGFFTQYLHATGSVLWKFVSLLFPNPHGIHVIVTWSKLKSYGLSYVLFWTNCVFRVILYSLLVPFSWIVI